MAELLPILRASRLLHGIDDALLEEVARETTVRRLHESEHLWRAGEKAEHFTVIRRGLMQIVRHLPSGEIALLGLFGPHESIGDAATLDHRPYPADAVALSEEVEVLRIRAEPLLAAMDRDPKVTRALNTSLLEHTRALHAKIEIMSAGSVPERLTALMQYLGDRFGDTLDDGSVVIPVALSRTALAWLVGARVETVIRTLTKWQRAGYFETNAGGFVVKSGAPLAEGED